VVFLVSTRLETRNSIANNTSSILLANSLSLQLHSRRILSASQAQRRDSSSGKKRKRMKKLCGGSCSCRSHMAAAATTTGKG